MGEKGGGGGEGVVGWEVVGWEGGESSGEGGGERGGRGGSGGGEGVVQETRK